MTAPTPPKITSPSPGNNAETGSARAPTREEIARSTVGVLKAGGRGKADLLLVDVGEGPVVVKDFGLKSRWTRVLGRIQIARECRAYRRLGRMAGLPSFLGRIDAHALALERIEGEQLAFATNRYRDAVALLARLRDLLDRIHRAGVFHQDLRGRENLLVRPDGEVVLVDLAGAVCLRPGGWLDRWFGRLVALSDEAAYLKWKALLAPDDLTREEEEFLRRFRRLRALWIFNRKRPRRDARP